MTRRIERINETLRAELSQLLMKDISDPRLDGIITITEVNVSPDMKNAQVFLSVLGTEDQQNDALEGILELAKEMEHPRAYEVASGLIKNVSETTMELLKMQKELKSLKEGEAPKTNVNNLYVGSTAELQEMLKGKTLGNGGRDDKES